MSRNQTGGEEAVKLAVKKCVADYLEAHKDHGVACDENQKYKINYPEMGFFSSRAGMESPETRFKNAVNKAAQKEIVFGEATEQKWKPVIEAAKQEALREVYDKAAQQAAGSSVSSGPGK